MPAVPWLVAGVAVIVAAYLLGRRNPALLAPIPAGEELPVAGTIGPTASQQQIVSTLNAEPVGAAR